MDEVSGKSMAVLAALALHLVIFAFLFLAMLSCSDWERAFGAAHVPPWLNPVQCQRSPLLSGPIIEASLVGIPASPAPKPVRIKPLHIRIPPPSVTPIAVKQGPILPVPTLPPVPKMPSVRNQLRAVDIATKSARIVRRVQVQKERQRMSEINAARQKADQLLTQLNALQRQTRHASKQVRLQQQRMAQLRDLAKTSQPHTTASAPFTKQASSGNAGQKLTLQAQYKAALIRTITQNWLRPDNIPRHVICPIRILQIPGGQVLSVQVLSACPYDALGRQSVKDAILRAQPLPYKGFESVFSRELILNFSVDQ